MNENCCDDHEFFNLMIKNASFALQSPLRSLNGSTFFVLPTTVSNFVLNVDWFPKKPKGFTNIRSKHLDYRQRPVKRKRKKLPFATVFNGALNCIILGVFPSILQFSQKFSFLSRFQQASDFRQFFIEAKLFFAINSYRTCQKSGFLADLLFEC